MTEAQTVFRQAFGLPASQEVLAPGRVELLGNHTDYNQGLVMALAVDKFISMAGSRRNDGKIELVSSAFPERAQFSISDLTKDPSIPWADYVKGLLAQFQKRGIHFSGFNAAIHSTLPLGAGLSSSAALLVATGLLVRKLFPYVLPDSGILEPPARDRNGLLPALSTAEKLSLAKICQAAENQFVGVNCGLLDYITSLFGKAHQVVLIDCLNLSVAWTPLTGEAVVVICHSGVKHALTGGEYNLLRRHCESASQALGVRSLRMVEPQSLSAKQSQLDPRVYDCARHIVGENQRVIFGERALRGNDLEQFGQYLYQSHESSRDLFKNSCPELDLLVELARAHPACLGARLTGGGFGGATLNLVRRDQAPAFQKYLVDAYAARGGPRTQAWVCQIVDGAV